jgi:hypothetical protein
MEGGSPRKGAVSSDSRGNGNECRANRASKLRRGRRPLVDEWAMHPICRGAAVFPYASSVHSGLGLLTPADVHHGLADRRVAALTGITFIFDPEQVKGKIMVLSPKSVSPAEALKFLESALALHGYSLLSRAEGMLIVLVGQVAPKAIAVKVCPMPRSRTSFPTSRSATSPSTSPILGMTCSDSRGGDSRRNHRIATPSGSDDSPIRSMFSSRDGPLTGNSPTASTPRSAREDLRIKSFGTQTRLSVPVGIRVPLQFLRASVLGRGVAQYARYLLSASIGSRREACRAG